MGVLRLAPGHCRLGLLVRMLMLMVVCAMKASTQGCSFRSVAKGLFR